MTDPHPSLTATDADDGWLIDLLLPFGVARAQAVAAATRGDWLDAALLVAGCGQVVEDHLHRSERLADRVATHLRHESDAPAVAVRGARLVATSTRRLHLRRRAVANLTGPRDRLVELSVRLAAAATDGGGPDPDLVAESEALFGEAAPWPSSFDEVSLRLPSCFRSFDQHPADMAALARMYAERHDDRSTPMVVVGVRTSGSYLGPFVAAELRTLGFAQTTLVTIRPGEDPDAVQRQAIGAPGARVVVVDDPPVSGAALLETVERVIDAGASAHRVTLLLGLPAGGELPDTLRSCDAIVLPRAAWHLPEVPPAALVTDLVTPLLAASGRRLDGPLAPTEDPVGPAPGHAPRTAREHGRAAFDARIVEASGDVEHAILIAQGAGIGLFGRHDVAVARRLAGEVPDVLGVVDGILLQLVGRDPDLAGPPTPEEATAYVLRRRAALPVERDRAATMHGRKAAWEVAAMLVGGALGPADRVLRISTLEPLVHRALAVDRPSVIDGRMTPDRWLPPVGTAACGDAPVKTEWGDGAFSNRDLWSYDAVADLAAIADDLDEPTAVLDAWARLGGEPIEPTRWLLHRLVAAWDRHRLGGLPQPAYGRRLGRALVEHVGHHLFRDVRPASGPWCALDLDGVLETGVMHEASAPGLAGGLALRSLVTHDHRVVLATGRSVGEVAVRIAAFGLPAGVAEYGAALVTPEQVIDRRSRADREALDRLRGWLTTQPGVTVDPAFAHAVRAWVGDRNPLPQELVDQAMAVARRPLAIIPGDDQTDIVPAGVSKAAGIRALIELLDPEAPPADRPLAFAAGDGSADVGMLGLAELACVPAHAEPHVRASATHPARHAYQAGLAEGVGRLLGHEPGGCPTCAIDLAADTRALLSALAVREAGPRAIPGKLLALTARSALRR